MKKNSGFTLVELALVLVIISTIIVGVMKGGSMIQASRISTARQHTSNAVVAKIPGLLAWYETSLKESFLPAETTDGSQISTWYDISPNSIIGQRNTLTRTASSSVTMERSGINGLPSLSFNGSGVLSLSAFYQGNLSPSNTFFIVASPSIADSTSKIFLDSYTGGRAIGFQSNKMGLWNGAGSYVFTGTSTTPISFIGGANYIITVNYNDSYSAIYQNSASTLAGGGNINITAITGRAGLIIAGNTSHTNDSNTFSGLISEVIIYDRALQFSERLEIIKYLAKKYNINLNDV
jgi:prepilin-type N-terminal cleavage/methylation domain-containing protein